MKLSYVVNKVKAELLNVLKVYGASNESEFYLFMVNFNGDIYSGNARDEIPVGFTEDNLVYRTLIYTGEYGKREYNETEIDDLTEELIRDFINHAVYNPYEIDFENIDSNSNIFTTKEDRMRDDFLDFMNCKQIYCRHCNEPVTFIDSIDFDKSYDTPVTDGINFLCHSCQFEDDISQLACRLKSGHILNYQDYLHDYVPSNKDFDDVLEVLDFIDEREENYEIDFELSCKRYIEFNVYNNWQIVIEIEPKEDGSVYLGFWIKGQNYGHMSFMYGHFEKDGKIDFNNDYKVVQENLWHIKNNIDDYIEWYLEDMECLEDNANEKLA